MAAVAVGDRQNVAMEMHGRLRSASGAGGEAEQADIVRGGVAGGKFRRGARHHRLQTRQSVATESRDTLQAGRQPAGLFQFIHQPRVAERKADFSGVDRLRQFPGAKKRHRRDRDAAGLHDPENGSDEHRRIGGAQKHPIARDQTKLVDERIGDPVDPFGKLVIGP